MNQKLNIGMVKDFLQLSKKKSSKSDEKFQNEKKPGKNFSFFKISIHTSALIYFSFKPNKIQEKKILVPALHYPS